jgi:hypothetical protein
MQDIAEVALAKGETWDYALPKPVTPPPVITVGMAGTCPLMCEDGWRKTIGSCDQEGERRHTIYLGATPEYGEATFLDRLPGGPLRGAGRRGGRLLRVPGSPHRVPGDRLLARRRVRLGCGRCPLRR